MKLQDINVDHLVAGVSGGLVSTAFLHPLDLVKIRLQVNDGDVARPKYSSSVDCARQIIRTAGVKGLYQGVTPNMWGAGLSWGFYFFFYNNLKSYMQDGDSKVSLSATQHMLAAAQGGLLTLTMTNPIWVAKTRLCLQYSTDSVIYRGMADTLIQIYKQEGIAGLYKGYIPGIFGVSHGALQFMAYEELKKGYYRRYKLAVDTRLGPMEYIAFAALSKMFAVVTTYPYQVIRSRLQDRHKAYPNISQLVSELWRNEGWRGFYKGLGPNLVRVTPACCITFVVYESLMTWFKTHRETL